MPDKPVDALAAIRRLEEAAAEPPAPKRGPAMTPPGARRDPDRPGITIAPPLNKRKAAKDARKLNRKPKKKRR